MAAIEIVIAAVAIGAAFLLVRVDRELAEGLIFARAVIFGAIGFGISLLLIGTGVPALMLVGALGLFFIFLFIFAKNPHQTARTQYT